MHAGKPEKNESLNETQLDVPESYERFVQIEWIVHEWHITNYVSDRNISIKQQLHWFTFYSVLCTVIVMCT